MLGIPAESSTSQWLKMGPHLPSAAHLPSCRWTTTVGRMVSPLPVLRRILPVLLAAGVLGLVGCRSGLAPGEGPGIKSFQDGELNGNIAGPMNAVKDAMLQTLVEMGVLNATEQATAVLVEINARTLQDVPLEITVSRVSDELTKVRIHPGNDDRDLARSIYDRVRARIDRQYQ